MQEDKPSTETKSEEASTRDKILAAACTEFAEHGLDGARVDRIAERAGVNKAMLYYHFQSKEKLYEIIIKSFFEQAANQLKMRTSEGRSVADYLLGAAETHVQMSRKIPEFRKIFLRELASPREEVLEWIAEAILRSGVPQRGREQLQEAVASGQFRRIDMRQAMLSFITMSLGYLLLAPVMDKIFGIEDHHSFVEQRKHAVVDLFLNGVLVK